MSWSRKPLLCARPLHDLTLLFIHDDLNKTHQDDDDDDVSESMDIDCDTAACCDAFSVSVSMYAVAKSCDWLAKVLQYHRSYDVPSNVINLDVAGRERHFLALSECPRDFPILVVQLPLRSRRWAQEAIPSGFSEAQVRLFFGLITELGSRRLSDTSLASELKLRADGEPWREETLCDNVRTEFLALHALATRFQCRSMQRWLKSELIHIIDDENAPEVLRYICEWRLDPQLLHTAPVKVRDDCKDLYRVVLLWFKRLRDPAAVSPVLSRMMDEMQRIVEDYDRLDVFTQRFSLLPQPPAGSQATLRFQGAFVKCAECCDQNRLNMFASPSAEMTTVMASTDRATSTKHGHWTVFLREARNCSGARSLIIRRLAPSLIGDKGSAFFSAPEQADLCEQIAHHSATPEIDEKAAESAYECSASVEFVKRCDTGGLQVKDATQWKCPGFVLDARRRSSRFVIVMPLHWRAEEYYDGYCPFCKTTKRVSVMLYDITCSLLQPQHDHQASSSSKGSSVPNAFCV